jgi:hypothetical protein
MPPGVEDRHADIWEALLTVADFAAGDWPTRARVAAVTHVTDAEGSARSLGVTLLADLRVVFNGVDRLSTETILAALTAMDESPWGDLRGKPLDARGLARRLAKYDVSSKPIRFDDGTISRGYEAAELTDPWSRYLSDDTVPHSLVQREEKGHKDVSNGVNSRHSGPDDAVTSVTAATPALLCPHGMAAATSPTSSSRVGWPARNARWRQRRERDRLPGLRCTATSFEVKRWLSGPTMLQVLFPTRPMGGGPATQNGHSGLTPAVSISLPNCLMSRDIVESDGGLNGCLR